MDHFRYLPLDLFPLIFDHLSFSELIVALFVCKLFGRQASRLRETKKKQAIDEVSASGVTTNIIICGNSITAVCDLFMRGCINVAQWFQKQLRFPLKRLKKKYQIFYSLCGAKGNLEFIKFFLKNCPCSPSRWSIPHSGGLYSLYCLKPNLIAQGAVIGGHIEILHWLRDILRCNHFLCASWAATAASHGHMEMTKNLIENFGCHLDGKPIAESAAYRGDLEMLKYVDLRNPNLSFIDRDGNMCSSAARGGKLAILKWLRTNEFPWTAATTTSAAKNGHMEVLRWAYENGCELEAEATSVAAIRGDLAMLKWLRENGCDWNPRVCTDAARKGHVEILKFATANGCKIGEEILMYAAFNGHLQMLIWGHEQQGLPLTKRIYENAMYTKHPNILAYLRANNCQ